MDHYIAVVAATYRYPISARTVLAALFQDPGVGQWCVGLLNMDFLQVRDVDLIIMVLLALSVPADGSV